MISRRFRENIRNVWNYIDICIYFFSKEFVQSKKKKGEGNISRKIIHVATQVSRSSLSKTEAATHSLSMSLRMQLVKPNVRPCKKKQLLFSTPEKRNLSLPLFLPFSSEKRKEKKNQTAEPTLPVMTNSVRSNTGEYNFSKI